MLWEERESGLRSNLGLLFIVPEAALAVHWTTLGLKDAELDPQFIERLNTDKLPRRITELLTGNPGELRSISERLRMNVVSWSWLVHELGRIEQGLNPSFAGDQALQRLLSGFRRQIEGHGGAGIFRHEPLAVAMMVESSL